MMSNLELAIGTVVLLIGSNLVGLLYSILALYSNLFKKYRIQEKTYKKGILRKRLPLYLFNLSLLMTMSFCSVYLLGGIFDQEYPGLWMIFSQVLFLFIIDDVWFYFSHRWMHKNRKVLRTIHSIHHRAVTPFPLEYLYVHPLEWMIGIIGLAIGFALMSLFLSVNIYAFWLFGLIRNLHEIHIHSDLELPLLSKIPFISTTRNHDLHHSKARGNYASTFAIWDKIMKTEIKEKKDDA